MHKFLFMRSINIKFIIRIEKYSKLIRSLMKLDSFCTAFSTPVVLLFYEGSYLAFTCPLIDERLIRRNKKESVQEQKICFCSRARKLGPVEALVSVQCFLRWRLPLPHAEMQRTKVRRQTLRRTE